LPTRLKGIRNGHRKGQSRYLKKNNTLETRSFFRIAKVPRNTFKVMIIMVNGTRVPLHGAFLPDFGPFLQRILFESNHFCTRHKIRLRITSIG